MLTYFKNENIEPSEVTRFSHDFLFTYTYIHTSHQCLPLFSDYTCKETMTYSRHVTRYDKATSTANSR